MAWHSVASMWKYHARFLLNSKKFHSWVCIYLDALNKCGVPAEETVFIDDAVRNLDGAAALGITPILMAANPESDVEMKYTKIKDLRELIRRDGLGAGGKT